MIAGKGLADGGLFRQLQAGDWKTRSTSPATSRIRTSPVCSARQKCWSTHPNTRGLACLYWKPWPVGPRWSVRMPPAPKSLAVLARLVRPGDPNGLAAAIAQPPPGPCPASGPSGQSGLNRRGILLGSRRRQIVGFTGACCEDLHRCFSRSTPARRYRALYTGKAAALTRIDPQDEYLAFFNQPEAAVLQPPFDRLPHLTTRLADKPWRLSASWRTWGGFHRMPCSPVWISSMRPTMYFPGCQKSAAYTHPTT